MMRWGWGVYWDWIVPRRLRRCRRKLHELSGQDKAVPFLEGLALGRVKALNHTPEWFISTGM